jgi:hypothetical protein
MNMEWNEMRVLVCGGRDYDDMETLDRVLDQKFAECPFSVLIHGDARGADSLARTWAFKRGVAQIACPANWRKFGLSAGRLRNIQMLQEHFPDLVIAFPGGNGTAHMVSVAKRAKVQVLEVR